MAACGIGKEEAEDCDQDAGKQAEDALKQSFLERQAGVERGVAGCPQDGETCAGFECQQ